MKKGILIHYSIMENNELYEGESLEDKVMRATTTNEPIENAAPLIYTDHKDGVIPDYDIRTDRWDVAQNAMDVVSRSRIAKSTAKIEQAEQHNTNQGGEE